ncbi:MAG: YjjG family noncanonical pyrimidine nucleotidase [Planctomycetota bacterium]|nr:YjjG family noncanonical pyrimidine nucleotidase [Planctomycetota bacterium]
MPYDWLLFDADGTLFDYDAAEGLALRSCAQLHGLAWSDAWLADYRRINAAAWHELEQGKLSPHRLRTIRFERWFEHLSVDADPQRFSDSYLEALSQQTLLIDNAATIIEALAPSHRMAIITNGLACVQRPRLAASPLAAHFPILIISEEVGSAKPERAIFDAAFELMGQPDPRRVLIIGDSLSSDIAGGHHYGIDTCWFNPLGISPGSIQPTHTIASLAELHPVVQSRTPGTRVPSDR